MRAPMMAVTTIPDPHQRPAFLMPVKPPADCCHCSGLARFIPWRLVLNCTYTIDLQPVWQRILLLAVPGYEAAGGLARVSDADS